MKVGNQLKIAVNALFLKNHNTGIGNYAIRIINELSLKENTQVTVYTQALESVGKYFYDQIEIVELPLSLGGKPGRLFTEQILLPMILKKRRFDVVFSPAFTIPLSGRNINIVTVHDMAYKIFPEASAYYARIYMNLFFDKSIKKADAVISVSDSTAMDIHKYFPNIERISTIYEGTFDFEQHKSIKPDSMDECGNFALVVGTITPRKNTLGIIKAFEKTRNKVNMKLVFSGNLSWKSKDLIRYIQSHNLEEVVVFLGFTSKENLKWLYENARMLIYCSFYEGFGFPPLEAMQSSTPVIASNVSSIPEVCGDAALLVDPLNIEEISEAIINLEENDIIRNELIDKGLERVKEFSWDLAAGETLKLFEKVLEEVK